MPNTTLYITAFITFILVYWLYKRMNSNPELEAFSREYNKILNSEKYKVKSRFED